MFGCSQIISFRFAKTSRLDIIYISMTRILKIGMACFKKNRSLFVKNTKVGWTTEGRHKNRREKIREKAPRLGSGARPLVVIKNLVLGG